MEFPTVLVVGGSGFIGSHVVAKLSAAGMGVIVPTRRSERARHLLFLPLVEVVQEDVHQDAVLRRLTHGVGAVVNLVGLLHSRQGKPYGPDFARAHVELPLRIVAACAANDVPRYLHMSALGASPDGPSDYQKSKAKAEVLVRASGLNFTIFAPSVIFGRGDSFLTKFASMIGFLPPLMPMILPGASARFQPVSVDDVARALVAAISDESSFGQRYELVGPSVYSLRELVAYVMRLAHNKHVIIGLPDFATRMLASVLQYVPTQPLTPDNVKSMAVDNVSNAPFPSFAGRASALEDVAPSYLGRAAIIDDFALARERAGH